MRFGPAAERFARDGDPPASVFTNRGKPRQASIAYAAGAARIAPDPVHRDPSPERPDWAHEQRRQFDEIAWRIRPAPVSRRAA
jgi:hypothetical protein